MPDSNFAVTSFLGGEWGKFAQGRASDPAYQTALALCLNSIPVEEGACVRRPGFQRIIPTHSRVAAKLLPFVSSTSCAFTCEISTDGSNGYLRFISGVSPIFTNDARTVTAASYSGSHVSLTLDTSSGWSVNEDVMFGFDQFFDEPTLEGVCRGRVMRVTAASGSSLTLGDDLGNAVILPAFVTGALVGATVMRIKRLSAPWLDKIDKLRIIQAETDAIILSVLQPPQTLEVTEPTGSNDPTFTFAPTAFVDGPYLDPQPGATTVSGYSGSITVTPLDGTTFSATDVGRHIRLFTQPAAWASGTTYTNGLTVTYNGGFWMSIASGTYATSNVGVPPGSPFTTPSNTQVILWVPAPTAAQWAWGKITAQASTSATVLLVTALNSANGMTAQILHNQAPMRAWICLLSAVIRSVAHITKAGCGWRAPQPIGLMGAWRMSWSRFPRPIS